MAFKIENTNLFKLVIINYTFFFSKENMFNCIDNNDIKEKYLINTEIKDKFLSKYSFTYLINSNEEDKKGRVRNIKNIIVKENKSGNMILIGMNFDNYLDNILILFFPKSYKFFSSLISKILPVKELKTTIEDMTFINNDFFIIVYFINGYFIILNTNFKIIKFYDPLNNFSLFEGSRIELPKKLPPKSVKTKPTISTFKTLLASTYSSPANIRIISLETINVPTANGKPTNALKPRIFRRNELILS